MGYTYIPHHWILFPLHNSGNITPLSMTRCRIHTIPWGKLVGHLKPLVFTYLVYPFRSPPVHPSLLYPGDLTWPLESSPESGHTYSSIWHTNNSSALSQLRLLGRCDVGQDTTNRSGKWSALRIQRAPRQVSHTMAVRVKDVTGSMCI